MTHIQLEDTQVLMAELCQMNKVLADERLEHWRRAEIACWGVVNIALCDKSQYRRQQKVKALMKVLDPKYAEYLRSSKVL